MIIYETTVPRFITLCNDPRTLSSEILFNLKEKFGISVGEAEFRSWTLSLPNVAKILTSNQNDLRKILIEFNIPNRRQRIDFIILGKNYNGIPSAWILELKQWSDITETAWNEFSVGRYTSSHPSNQALDYKSALEHEMGLYKKVDIQASAYLFNLKNKNSPLFKESYSDMLKQATLYFQASEHLLGREIDQHTIIRDGSDAVELLKEIKNYRPTEHFQTILEKEFESIRLIGSQKEIYNKIERFTRERKKGNKMTFLISGDPGSGKTIIAFKLFILIVKELKMNMQLMIPGQEVRDAFTNQWKGKVLSKWISGSAVWKGNEAAIIDEAHKAISRNTGLVNYQQMYRHLNFAIVFIDDDQVINRKGVTKEQVKEIAKKANHEVHEYTIDETFRNYGERTLIDWIDNILYGRTSNHGDYEYKQEKYINENRKFKLHGYINDDDFINAYYENVNKNKSTRMASLWHKRFYVGAADSDGNLPKTVPIGKYKMVWNPNQEWYGKLTKEFKKTYNSEVKHYAKHRRNFLSGNPKPEYIAYFNHIQGYEFDNIFVYIPNIFTYENNEIVFHRDRLAKEVKTSQTWSPTSKSKELNNRDPKKLNKIYFINRIKVMLTRGKKTTHIFAEDEKLNQYIFNSIK